MFNSIISVVLILLGVVLVFVGIVLSVINFPGAIVVSVGVLLWAIADRFVDITVFEIVIVFLLSIAASVFDTFLVLLGAKRFGASRWGMIGAGIGAVVGLLVGNILGLILGPFIGATLFELTFEKKESREALKAGFGTFLGFIGSVVMKFGLSIAIVLYVLLRLFV